MVRDPLPMIYMVNVCFLPVCLIFLAVWLMWHHRVAGSSAILGYALIAVYAAIMALASLILWGRFRHVRASHDPDETIAFNKQAIKLIRGNTLLLLIYFLGQAWVEMHRG